MVLPDKDNSSSLESDIQEALGPKYDVGVFFIEDGKLCDSSITLRPDVDQVLPTSFCAQLRVEQEFCYGVGLSLVVRSLDWDEAGDRGARGA